jgi:membrane protease YdiL (CAAX protease family)
MPDWRSAPPPSSKVIAAPAARREWSAKSPVDAGTPRGYPQLLRGPAHRAWRPLLSITLTVVVALILVTVCAVVGFFVLMLSGTIDLTDPTILDSQALTARLMDEPVMFLANNLGLAGFIPAAMLGVYAGHGWRPGWLASVTGRMRWGWLAISAGIVTVIYLLWVSVMALVDGGMSLSGGRNVAALIIITLLTTPLQAAGEEYLFRGVLTQAIGSWLRPPIVAVLVSGLSTAVMFAILHSVGVPQNLWLWLGRFTFGLVASYLTWRTGGLESAIAFHTVNNLTAMIPAILVGSLGETVSVSSTALSSTLLDLTLMAITTVVLVLVAKRLGLQREHDPARQPGGVSPMTVCWPAGGWGSGGAQAGPAPAAPSAQTTEGWALPTAPAPTAPPPPAPAPPAPPPPAPPPPAPSPPGPPPTGPWPSAPAGG